MIVSYCKMQCVSMFPILLQKFFCMGTLYHISVGFIVVYLVHWALRRPQVVSKQQRGLCFLYAYISKKFTIEFNLSINGVSRKAE